MGVNNQNMGEVFFFLVFICIIFQALALYFSPSDTVIMSEVQVVIIVACFCLDTKF